MRRLNQFSSHLLGTFIPSPVVDPRGGGEAKMEAQSLLWKLAAPQGDRHTDNRNGM